MGRLERLAPPGQGRQRADGAFNLADDPRETHAVAAEHPEIVERMWSYVFSSHEEPENPKFRMRIEKSKSDENE